MIIKQNKNKKSRKKFPLRIILDNGRKIPVPSQHDFKDSFIRNHGCSLVGFYMTLRFKGKKKNMQQCLSYCKQHLTKGAKYPLTQLCKGINNICSGTPAVYKKTLGDDKIKANLSKGRMILFEEGNPIHTVVLLQDSKTKKIWRFSDGCKNVTTVEKENNRRCTNKRYEGLIIVK